MVIQVFNRFVLSGYGPSTDRLCDTERSIERALPAVAVDSRLPFRRVQKLSANQGFGRQSHGQNGNNVGSKMFRSL